MRHSRSYFLAGSCALFCACGPMEESVDPPTTDSDSELELSQDLNNAPQCTGPRFVADLAPGTGSTNLLDSAEVDGVVYMSIVYGPSLDTYYLWKLEEKSGGQDLHSGWKATLLLGNLSDAPKRMTVVGSKVFFILDDGIHGSELWKTDGTPGGTRLVEDINPFGSAFSDNPLNPVAVGKTLYFAADDGTHGTELWRSDGTTGGTRLVKDIFPGLPSSSPGQPLLDGKRLLFAADDGSKGRELWKSDGTSGGTRRVRDIFPGAMGSSPDQLFRLEDGTVFFVADDGTHGRELWTTDGTKEDTELVEDIRAGSAGSDIAWLTSGKKKLYFTANDGVHGSELWTSMGCEDDTRLVKDIRPGAMGSAPNELVPLKGNVILFADDATHGREPWRSNGTTAGTLMLADTHPTSPPSGYGPTSLVAGKNKVFFYATTPDTGKEPWVTDGTPSGTRLIKDLRPGPEPSISGDPFPPFVVGGGATFPYYNEAVGVELVWTDGTASGTRVADINPGPDSSSPVAFRATHDWVYLVASDGIHNSEPWALSVGCFPKN
ncbi:ELWxxDGT repeat protein [Myxococcus llanfairpwllgwyngyllgogerychwyrndrobwllllantysiliogogogochensis]|nr:ELWxxDGT repeat protein [Myxococcus llanfairpwllgwyngyllgogerychwyrndrobwllllantysiliogogogochensis]